MCKINNVMVTSKNSSINLQHTMEVYNYEGYD